MTLQSPVPDPDSLGSGFKIRPGVLILEMEMGRGCFTKNKFFLAHAQHSDPEARGHGGVSYPGAAHGQKYAITVCPVRESNLGPLCAKLTTLTTHLN